MMQLTSVSTVAKNERACFALMDCMLEAVYELCHILFLPLSLSLSLFLSLSLAVCLPHYINCKECGAHVLKSISCNTDCIISAEHLKLNQTAQNGELKLLYVDRHCTLSAKPQIVTPTN